MALFIKVETAVLTDEKFDGLSDAAFALWVKAMLYAKQHETYGMVSEKKLRSLASHLDGEQFEDVIIELLSVELWEKIVTDRNVTRYGQNCEKWDRHQTSKDNVEALRNANAERQKRFRDRHKQTQNTTENVTDNVTSHVSNAEVTGPEPEQSKSKSNNNPPKPPEGDSVVLANQNDTGQQSESEVVKAEPKGQRLRKAQKIPRYCPEYVAFCEALPARDGSMDMPGGYQPWQDRRDQVGMEYLQKSAEAYCRWAIATRKIGTSFICQVPRFLNGDGWQTDWDAKAKQALATSNGKPTIAEAANATLARLAARGYTDGC